MPKSLEELRNRLSALRERHGAVAEFCRKAGFNRQTVENWLDGKSAPGMENIDRIADALGVEAWRLIMPAGEEAVPRSELERTADQLRKTQAALDALLAAKPELSANWRRLIGAFGVLDDAEAECVFRLLTQSRRDAERGASALKPTKK